MMLRPSLITGAYALMLISIVYEAYFLEYESTEKRCNGKVV